ncbi:ABC transporter ATP-binding protein [Mangrovibrevibacter kandeliae]|uniref:ABC transporter ATP-binding protein n=1 Tax=Mangrovibrevibacter kandeliae TaxID=2968473 RepID=UPI002117FBE9|nr:MULTISPECIES: ABC transporter ATP-binding protein [unclassified Aurantimonas]MCQ8782069.1 ABC transporter ATP-binding protein [Aurantimonas sp. CSK15Z-1]MCW4115271.1 ABC transporter ATP-binding protein [Aurantimonas sp. MSK8Z-1]
MLTDTPILEIDAVSKRFVTELDIAERTARLLGSKVEPLTVHAVDGVRLSVRKGEVLGLVGESGCGKSTLGRMVAGLMPPSEGQIRFRGRDVAALRGAEAREAALKIQMVFQDPMSSLNPRLRVDEIVGEAPRVHGIVSRREQDGYVDDLLNRVGLDPTTRKRYPHQFSGGQRARIGIARALAVKPDFIVCDESVAALDVSIQAQILNLFMRLREELDLTYLFISHDLGVVEHISDRIAVMYLGRLVELGAAEDVLRRPNHPYTQALVAEIPTFETKKKAFNPIKGEIPSPLKPPTGCHFHPRCPHAHQRCIVERPALKEIAPGRLSACHLNDEARAAA